MNFCESTEFTFRPTPPPPPPPSTAVEEVVVVDVVVDDVVRHPFAQEDGLDWNGRGRNREKEERRSFVK